MDSLPQRLNDSMLSAKGNRSTKSICVGIVGAGLMGKWHARAAQRAGGEIIGALDVDQKQANLLAAKYRTARSFDSAAEMLDEKSLNMVHVCTPTSTHRNLIEYFVKAGVNIFVEKPIAHTAADAIYLYNLAEQYGVQICPAHQFAFQHGTEKAKKWLKSIGELIYLQATICSAGGINAPADRLDSIAADILPHPLSLFQTFLGGKLPMENWEVLRPFAGELRITGFLREISLAIFVSLQARPTINTFQICGTRGTIHLDLFHGFAYFEGGRVSKLQKILRPFDSSAKRFSAAALNLIGRSIRSETAYPGLQKLIYRFYQSIRTNGELPITAAQAVDVARVRDFLMTAIPDEESANKQ